MAMMISVLIVLVGLLHVYFLVLEMFFWTKPRGLRIFGQSLEAAKASAVLASNQGLYNGFLAAGLFWSVLHPNVEIGFQLKVFFLTCVMVAGGYGAYTVNKKILFVQFAPALIALLFVLLSQGAV